MMNTKQQDISYDWFEALRNEICENFENLEQEFSVIKNLQPPEFVRKEWSRPGGGGGVTSIMKGNLFEKVGVNISKVHGEFSGSFSKEIPGAVENAQFFATGISIVAHMASPLLPPIPLDSCLCFRKKYLSH